jgi:hypothetical protein
MRAQETYALPILSDRWLVRWEDRFRGLRRSRYGKIQGRPHWLDELQIRRRVRPLGVAIVARESCRISMHGLNSLTLKTCAALIIYIPKGSWKLSAISRWGLSVMFTCIAMMKTHKTSMGLEAIFASKPRLPLRRILCLLPVVLCCRHT